MENREFAKNILEETSCIFCGSNKKKPLYSRIDARYFLDENLYTMNQCLDCESYFLSPRIKKEFLSRYYPNEFYYLDHTQASIWRQELQKNYKKYTYYLKNMKPGRILDIGCRDGSFVKFMELLGWQAEGYEYSNEVENRFGCNIRYENLYQFETESFDVITLWAVLEHLYNPNDYIEYCQKILKPGEIVIIQVPKYNSFTGKFLFHEDVPRHASAFTSTGLVKYIERFGFKLKKINTRCQIFYGNSYGFLYYASLLLRGKTQSEALLPIYKRGLLNETRLTKLDFKISLLLDVVLRRLDYWGQMTALFEKTIL